MTLDVSVVVPVFNAGVNLDGCVRSLLAQTLPADRFEILLVDDGSTDGTAADIDRWVAQHPERVRAFHQPHSGWPGRPRNLGVEHARGDYIQFVDSDDELTPHALERVVAAARSCDADIVLPKSASDFRGVNHDLYRVNRDRITWLDFPLVESLVPHKLVRRRFLLEHDLHFADAPRHVEDQLFFAHAYAHAASVAVVADEVCYLFRRRRGFGRNLGDVVADPDDYYRDLEDVLDVVDRHVDDEASRLHLYERFYRVEILGRLRDRQMLDYDDGYRRRLFQRIRRLVESRIPVELDAQLPSFVRVQARLVRDHDLPALLRYAGELDSLRIEPARVTPSWIDGRLRLDVGCRVSWRDAPLRTDILEDIAGSGLRDGDFADVVVVGRGDGATWFVPPQLDVADDGDGLVVSGEVRLDPRTVLGGTALTPGLWDLRLRLRIGGLTRTARFEPVTDASAAPTCVYDGSPHSVMPYLTATGGLALDVDGWGHSLTEHVAADAVADSPGKSWRVSSVIASGRVSAGADVFVRADDGSMRTQSARLRVGPQGGSLVCRRRLPPGETWIRVGPAGGNTPVRLGAVSPAT